jgi:hypothetical protein
MYNLQSGDLFKDVLKGPALVTKGKLPFLPHRIKGIDHFQRIFKNAERVRKEKQKEKQQKKDGKGKGKHG